jgi:hypothetical protein
LRIEGALPTSGDTTTAASTGALRTTALIAALLGAVGSVALMLWTGRRNPSWLLLFAFVLWVLSPFALLALGDVVSRRWAPATRTALHVVAVMVAVLCLIVYGIAAFAQPMRTAAAPFVLFPPVCWAIIAVAVGAAALMTRGRGNR